MLPHSLQINTNNSQVVFFVFLSPSPYFQPFNVFLGTLYINDTTFFQTQYKYI